MTNTTTTDPTPTGRVHTIDTIRDMIDDLGLIATTPYKPIDPDHYPQALADLMLTYGTPTYLEYD
ncbi:hypothetical protein [Bifidobacterium samirii]|uniref:Uncharacterized protein n=1 Tax=Bifidobacterium samirii TaxID=2306974 RepID=A0A430FJF3_9BIFI|nr:hypothetical protein [Bifidobacterium samirii]RSX53009.1 hypothetical protein D2E24_1680 [Bifidobacterium samirii]